MNDEMPSSDRKQSIPAASSTTALSHGAVTRRCWRRAYEVEDRFGLPLNWESVR